MYNPYNYKLCTWYMHSMQKIYPVQFFYQLCTTPFSSNECFYMHKPMYAVRIYAYYAANLSNTYINDFLNKCIDNN